MTRPGISASGGAATASANPTKFGEGQGSAVAVDLRGGAAGEVIIPADQGWSEIAEQLKRRRMELASEASGSGSRGEKAEAVGGGGGGSQQLEPRPSQGAQLQHRSALPGARRSALGPLLNHLRRKAAEEGSEDLPGKEVAAASAAATMQ